MKALEIDLGCGIEDKENCGNCVWTIKPSRRRENWINKSEVKSEISLESSRDQAKGSKRKINNLRQN